MQAALLLALATGAPGCHRSDPGTQCTSASNCAAGSYCGAGICRSDCASDGDCATGSICTLLGQCVSPDSLYCEEGSAPVPADYARALGAGNTFLMQDLADCSQNEVNLPLELPINLALEGEVLFGLCSNTLTFQSALGNQLAVQELGACRPALIESDQVLWHALPLGLSIGFNSSDSLDTVMEARIDGGFVDYLIGLGQITSLGDPVPGRIWGSGTGLIDGSRLVATYQAGPLRAALIDALGSDAGSELPGSDPSAVQAVRTVGSDGGVVVDVLLQYSGATMSASRAAHLERAGDHLTLRVRDPLDGGPLYTEQVTTAFAGRYDDALDGGHHTLCWSIGPVQSDNGEPIEQLDFVRDIDSTYGVESSCLFTAVAP